MAFNQSDQFFEQSKIQGFRSRSAFKLIEMNKKFNFIKKNSLLLDLGSSPGGWSQVARKEIIKGKILAVDIKSMEKISNVGPLPHVRGASKNVVIVANGTSCRHQFNDLAGKKAVHLSQIVDTALSASQT